MTVLNSGALSADIVLLHGKVVTVDSKDTIQEAVAIKAGRIMGTGSSSDMKQFTGENTEVIDLMGKLVIPGIIDSHTHPSFAATRFLEIDCRAPEIRGIKDIQAAVLTKAKEIGPGVWVRVGNYNDSKLIEKRQITRWELDAVTPNNPVYILSDTGHQAVVNSKALEIADITKDTPDPAGGKIDRDDRGEATGLLYELASQLIAAKIPVYTIAQMKESMKRLFSQFSRWGITSTHDASGENLGIRTYQQILSEGIRKVRINLMVRLNSGTEDTLEHLKSTPSSSIGYMYGIGDQYAENFGPERSQWLHPHKTMQEMGIIAGGNNDCPITFYSPFKQIYTAVTRKTVTGQVVGPGEAISVMDAIRVYTWNGAYLAREEHIKGSIETGKLADMIVLDRDILSVPTEELKDTEVVTTIVDGKIVFQRD